MGVFKSIGAVLHEQLYKFSMTLIERDLVPDQLIRVGIRSLLRKRLAQEVTHNLHKNILFYSCTLGYSCWDCNSCIQIQIVSKEKNMVCDLTGR